MNAVLISVLCMVYISVVLLFVTGFWDKIFGLKPGDVIIRKIDEKNKTKDITWCYQTVCSVNKTSDGRVWFKSYTSDKNGNKASYSNWNLLHLGSEFTRSVWKIKNHVNLNELDVF